MGHPVHALSLTRLSLHRLAEHVLAASVYRETGRTDLRPCPGGISTPPFGPDNRTIAVELGTLVARSTGSERRAWVGTLRAAGGFVGMEPGAPGGAYAATTSCRLDAPLTLETSAMQVLADWYMFGQLALARVAATLIDEPSTEAVVRPQGLDLTMRVGRVDVGFSPGDELFDQPYAYVGHGPSGTVRAMNELSSVDAAVEFLLEGHERITATTASARRNA
jgi:hypothetical protein